MEEQGMEEHGMEEMNGTHDLTTPEP